MTTSTSKHNTNTPQPIEQHKDDFLLLEIPLSNGQNISCDAYQFKSDYESSERVLFFNENTSTNQPDLLQAMGKRPLLMSIKHKVFSPANSPLEITKFQATHGQFIARDISSSKVATINNPQPYQGGEFGSPGYPSILFELNYNGIFKDEEILELDHSILAWSAILNTVSVFPSNYNGNDKLSAVSQSDIKDYGEKAIQAALGHEEAIAWFNRKDKYLYCAELCYLAINLGTLHPLTKDYWDDIYIESLDKKFKTGELLFENRNPHISSFKFRLPKKGLKLPKHNGYEHSFITDHLALYPMTVSEYLTAFIKWSFGKNARDENTRTNQEQLFRESLPMVTKFLGAEINELDPLFNQVSATILEDIQNQNSFKERIKPVLAKIDKIISQKTNASSLFIPPHAFLVRALEERHEKKLKGMVSFSFFSHFFEKKDATRINQHTT